MQEKITEFILPEYVIFLKEHLISIQILTSDIAVFSNAQTVLNTHCCLVPQVEQPQ